MTQFAVVKVDRYNVARSTTTIVEAQTLLEAYQKGLSSADLINDLSEEAMEYYLSEFEINKDDTTKGGADFDEESHFVFSI